MGWAKYIYFSEVGTKCPDYVYKKTQNKSRDSELIIQNKIKVTYRLQKLLELQFWPMN